MSKKTIILKKNDALKLATLHSAVCAVENRSGVLDFKQLHEARRHYDEFRRKLKLNVLQAEEASWIVIKAWNDDIELGNTIKIRKDA